MGSKMEKETTDEECNGMDEGDKFTIHIKTMNGTTEAFLVTQNVLVNDLIARFKKRNNCSKSTKILLIHKGKRLNETKRLGDYEIEDDEVLFGDFRLAGC